MVADVEDGKEIESGDDRDLYATLGPYRAHFRGGNYKVAVTFWSDVDLQDPKLCPQAALRFPLPEKLFRLIAASPALRCHCGHLPASAARARRSPRGCVQTSCPADLVLSKRFTVVPLALGIVAVGVFVRGRRRTDYLKFAALLAGIAAALLAVAALWQR